MSPARTADDPCQKRAKAPSKTKEKETKNAKYLPKMGMSNIPTISGTTTLHTEMRKTKDDLHPTQNNRGTSAQNRTLTEVPRTQHDPGNRDRSRRPSASKTKWKHK
jgi:hypothetical protein